MKFILLMFLSTSVFANDLIFKNSFENTVSISGTITGLNSTGMSLLLTRAFDAESIFVDNNGSFVFASDLVVGEFWQVDITILPTSPQQQSCTINNNSGAVPVGGVNNVLIECNNTAWRWNEMNWDEGGWQ